MTGIYAIIGIVMLVFGILQIVLFFKLWGMTNDVRRLTDHVLNSGKRVVQSQVRSDSQPQEPKPDNKESECPDNSYYLIIIITAFVVVSILTAIGMSI